MADSTAAIERCSEYSAASGSANAFMRSPEADNSDDAILAPPHRYRVDRDQTDNRRRLPGANDEEPTMHAMLLDSPGRPLRLAEVARDRKSVGEGRRGEYG